MKWVSLIFTPAINPDLKSGAALPTAVIIMTAAVPHVHFPSSNSSYKSRAQWQRIPSPCNETMGSSNKTKVNLKDFQILHSNKFCKRGFFSYRTQNLTTHSWLYLNMRLYKCKIFGKLNFLMYILLSVMLGKFKICFSGNV